MPTVILETYDQLGLEKTISHIYKSIYYLHFDARLLRDMNNIQALQTLC